VDSGGGGAVKYNLCDCPSSEPGKIKVDINEHKIGCRFRKLSSKYASNTSAVPGAIRDGCSLGVVLGEESF
jgi:hypothetical protein